MTKEKILAIFMLIIMLATIMLPVTVEATEAAEVEWTNFKNAKYIFEDKAGESGIADYVLKVKDVTFNKESRYYIFFSNVNEKPKIEDIMDNDHKMRSEAQEVIENGEEVIMCNVATSRIGLMIEKAGEDLYIWIIEVRKDGKRRELVSGQLVKKPAQYATGKRMTGFFDSYGTSIFFHEPTERHESKNKRKINLKIGKVTDKNILLSIKNKEPGSLDKLMLYAKNANSIYETTQPVGRRENNN